MKLTLDDLTLRRREGDWQDREVKVGTRFGNKRVVNLKAYDVLAPDGTQIGIVAQEMQTFERKPYRGATWVSRRWESPRWFFYLGDDRIGRRSFEQETRKRALEDLLAAYERKQKEAAVEA